LDGHLVDKYTTVYQFVNTFYVNILDMLTMKLIFHPPELILKRKIVYF